MMTGAKVSCAARICGPITGREERVGRILTNVVLRSQTIADKMFPNIVISSTFFRPYVSDTNHRISLHPDSCQVRAAHKKQGSA